MQKSTKRLLSMLAVLALVLTMAPGGILAVETRADEIEYGSTNWDAAKADKGANIQENAVAGKAKQESAKELLNAMTAAGCTDATTRLGYLNDTYKTCPFCQAENVVWESLPETATAVIGEKHYVVAGNYTSEAETVVYMGSAEATNNNKLCLLMDSATISLKGRLLLAEYGSAIHIGGIGDVTSDMSAVTGASTTNTKGVLSLDKGPTTVGVRQLNLYGGNFVSTSTGAGNVVLAVTTSIATTHIWHDNVNIGPELHVAAGSAATNARANVQVQYGSVNMYAGTIRNGYSGTQYQGKNVYLFTDGKFNMYGGTIEGGSGYKDTRGANICMNSSGAVATIYGGTIKQDGVFDGGTNAFGGNVYVGVGATLKVKGGKLLATLPADAAAGSANAQNGGNIYVIRKGRLEISGTALISGGRAKACGGNIALSEGKAADQATGGTLEMTGGKVTGGACTGGTTYGGNLYLSGVSGYAAQATISGGIVEGGLTTGNNATWGGNIHISKYCTVGVSDTAVITGGRAASCGGNITASGELNVTGGTITKGICNYTGDNTTIGGGNVFIPKDGKFEISSGTISGGYTTGTNAMHGGNILQSTGGTLTISNTAEIKEGRAAYGGNILTHDDDLSISAGTIKDGYATVNGGNFWVGGTATLTLDGISVSGGTGAYNGGNIFANGTVNLKDVTIENGKSPKGGNIQIYSGKLTMTEDTVVKNGGGTNTGNYATWGGNIFMINAKDGSNLKGTISGGRGLNGGNACILGGTAAPAADAPVPTITINANFSGAVAKYAANLYTGTRVIDATSTSPGTRAVYAINLNFVGGVLEKGSLVDLNGLGGLPTYSDIVVCTPAEAVDENPAGEGVKVFFKNGFDPVNMAFTQSTGKNTLTIDSSWTGDIELYAGAYYAGNDMSSDFAVTGALNGTVKNLNGHKIPVEANGKGGLKLVDFVVIDEEGSVGYANAADALAAANKNLDAHIVTGVDFTMNGEEIVIDAMDDVTVSGTGKLYGIDYENISSGYKNTNGWVTVADGIEVQPQCGNYFALKNTDAENHPNAWTFHHVAVALKSITVNVDNAGLYYKAEYKFDDALRKYVTAYGVKVGLEKDNLVKETNSDDFTAHANGSLIASSHGVFNIFETEDSETELKANATAQIFAKPYIVIQNTDGEASDVGVRIEAEEAIGYSMVDAMKQANKKWNSLGVVDNPATEDVNEDTRTGIHEALKNFINKWETAFGELKSELTNIFPAPAPETT